MKGAFTRGNARASRTRPAGGMDLVDVGHRAIALREITDAVHRRDVTVHRVESLEDDQLGSVNRLRGQQLFEMAEVVVAPNSLFCARLAHTLDHRIVVEGV